MDRLNRLTRAECYAYGVCTPLIILGLAENAGVFLMACFILSFFGLIYHWSVTA